MGWTTAAVMTVLAVVLRRPPQWGSIIGAVGVGQMVNWFLEVLPEPGRLPVRVGVMVGALVILYTAISVGVTTNLGTGPIELVMLGLHDRGLPMQVSRWSLEAALLAVGIALGGQFGIGLILGVVWSPCVGPTLGAAVVLASQGSHLAEVAVLMGVFGIGAALPVVALAYASRSAIARMRGRLLQAGKRGKAALGAVMIAIAVFIISGIDKPVEAWLVQQSPDWLTNLTTRF